jgi:histidinol phosphatase-like PHP family hydrolase
MLLISVTMHDFHTHTFLSDGELLPIELIRRAVAMGHEAIAITDHASESNLNHIIERTAADCALAEEHYSIAAIPGVELTHVPPLAIERLAKKARVLGAEIVIVHGETIVEPVMEGTNAAAVEAEVDILAHPGLITREVAEKALESGVYLEITSRKGHCLTNGHVVRIAREAGAKMLINTDTHGPGDLINKDFARKVGFGAGLSSEEVDEVTETNTRALLAHLGRH